MYIIGLGAVCFTGASDIVSIMLEAGLGLIAVIIVIISTVTTTYLDVYSAGVSTNSIFKALNEKRYAMYTTIVGTLLAVVAPVNHFEGFLYVIGSVFAPMFAILFTDYFILKRDYSHQKFNGLNILLWLLGFSFYRYFMAFDSPIGITIPVMLVVATVSLIVNFSMKRLKEGIS